MKNVRTVELEITPEIVERSTKLLNEHHFSICSSCLVSQAIRDYLEEENVLPKNHLILTAGKAVSMGTGFSHQHEIGSLDKRGYDVVNSGARDWPQYTGEKFSTTIDMDKLYAERES